jgi:hypothetical protein
MEGECGRICCGGGLAARLIDVANQDFGTFGSECFGDASSKS